MPEARDRPLARWGEELRRARRQRRSGKVALGVAVAVAALTTATLGTLIWRPDPLLLWNASASSPIGLYAIGSPDDLAVGDMAAAWPPAEAREVASERGYLPSNVPLVKQVAAAAGDRVCAAGEAIFINGRLAAARRLQDLSGRALPSWTGCTDLQQGEWLLLTLDQSRAFDGRYFGITRTEDVIGRARLLWRG